MPFLIGFGGSVAALLGCMALSLLLLSGPETSLLPLLPLFVNALFYLILCGIVVMALVRRRWRMALAPPIALMTWAVISEGHAQLLMRTAERSLGAQALSPIGRIDTLIVTASKGSLGGLPLNPARTNGVSSTSDWMCDAWCVSALQKGLVSTLVLRDKPGPNSAPYRQFRIGGGSECAAADAATQFLNRPTDPTAGPSSSCVVSMPLHKILDGYKIEMAESAGLPRAGGFCCETARIVKLTAGQETEVAHWKMGNAVTALAVPVIFSGISSTYTGWKSHFMLRDVPLGRRFRFDDVLEAVLGSTVEWTAKR